MFTSVIRTASDSGWVLSGAVLFLYVIACIAHFQIRGHRRWFRALLMYGFWLFGLVIVLMTILPLPVITGNFCERYWLVETPQTAPFKFVRDIARVSGYTRGMFSMRATVNSFAFLQALGNLAVFLPLGVYVCWFTRRGLLVAGLVGFGISLAIEVTQGTGIYGLYPCPYRQFDVDDVILNTSGAVIGYIGAAVVGIFGIRRALNVETTV